MEKRFDFLFPITDFSVNPAVHFTDLLIHAVIDFQKKTDDKLTMAVTIDSINYLGTPIAPNIAPLLKVINRDLYMEILEAANEHSKDIFKI